MNLELGALIRNMSAPPRTTLSFASLAPAQGASGEAITDGAAMKFVCRLRTSGFTPKQCRLRRHREGNGEAFSLEDRIRLAYPRVRYEVAGRKSASPEACRHAIDAPIEMLVDELRDLAATIPLPDLEVPAFGIFMPPHNTAREAEGSLIRTIAILGRRRGSIFLREADPIVWTAMDGELRDLWTPIATTEKLR